MLDEIEQWLVVALGTSGNIVANAVEEYSRGHRAFPVAAYYRIGSCARPDDLYGRDRRDYVRYLSRQGSGKSLRHGARQYDMERSAIRGDLMRIKDCHPTIKNVLLISSVEGGTAGVYQPREASRGKDYRLLSDILDCLAARKLWVVALGPSTALPDRVLRENARLSLRTLEEFAACGRREWPPIGINVTYVTRTLVSNVAAEQPRLVGQVVATILDAPSGYAEPGTLGWLRSPRRHPALNPSDLAGRITSWNVHEPAAEVSPNPVEIGQSLV